MPAFSTSNWSHRYAGLLPNLFAGLTAGLVTLVYSISFAALIFSGNLAPFFPQGLGIALIGATVAAILVASRSAFPFALAGPESNSVILLALMASAIGSSLQFPRAAEHLYPTVWLTIALSTMLTGVFLFVLGWFRLGQWARFIPYPVIGGFLAGTGWLIVRSSFKVMIGVPLDFAELPLLMQSSLLPHWAIGLLFALVLCFALSRYKHFFVLPGLLIGGMIGFDGVWWLSDRFLAKLDPSGWFFEPFSAQALWSFWRFSTFAQVDWLVVLHESGTMITMMLIVVISILLNATGLELATSQTVDLNRELRANGIANLVAGLCGGMVGYLSINRSLLNHRAGGDRRFSGMISGGMCAGVLLFGSSFLAFLPKPILGGVLLYIGLGLMFRWGYQAWFQFPPVDYALILLILVIIATGGFLPGVGAGILIACFLFIFNYGRTPVIKYTLSGATYRSNVRRSFPQQKLLQQKGDCIYVLVLQGFIFFGTAHALLDDVRHRLEKPELSDLKFVIFDFRLVTGLDSSVMLSFIKMKQLALKAHVMLVFTELQASMQHQLQLGRLIEPDDHVCCLFDDLDQGLEWCENQLLETSKLRRSRFVPLALLLKTAFPNADLVSQLMSYLKPIKLEAGSYLFRQGDPFDGLYFLEFGRLSVMLEPSNGKSRRICSYLGVNTIGEMGLYQQAPRTASVIADQPSSLYFLSTEAFALIETQEPLLAASFHKFIVMLLAARLVDREQELTSLLQ
ncbi:MAG: SLC26A/SulP transporter family protein [Leptolyngbya sp. BL-A-14]